MIEWAGDGYRLRNPRHRAEFTDGWVRVGARSAGPEWRWRLVRIEDGSSGQVLLRAGAVSPSHAAERTIRYDRGSVIEEYVAEAGHITQRFVIPHLLSSTIRELVLVGVVESSGRLEPTARGWAWRGNSGEVWLTGLEAVDGEGAPLSARLLVEPTQVRVEVQMPLSGPRLPLTISLEIGANDFRISDMGGTGDSDYGGYMAAVAYNSTTNEYLVVWTGDDTTGSLVDGEFEIFGQRIAGSFIFFDDFERGDTSAWSSVVP